MDLHSPQIQGFFKKPVDHLFAMPILCKYIRSKEIENLVVVSPDAGFTKSARNYAKVLNTPVAIADKFRSGHDEKAEILELIGEVKGKNCLIVDDFTLSGGTLVDLARTLKKHRAKKIYACVSHAVLSDQGLKALEDSPIEELVVTDSIENPRIIQHPKVTVVSVAPMFAQAVRIIHNKESLSQLFDQMNSSLE
jgi:ribose-phosphate pyrophosphokinase